MLQRARDFFAARKILEVDPCSLVRHAPVDANIDVIEASVTDSERGFLHTSPEYAMKRLLSAGCGDIFFLGHVFRKGEVGRLHNPEFTMAEWYRLSLSFEEMIQETCDFLFLFFGILPTRMLSYREAFRQYAGIDYSRDDLTPLLPHYAAAWSRDTAIHYLLTHVVEPNLGRGELTILEDYPPIEAALACVVEKKGERVAERFEIYYEGVELTNGYHELGDASILRQRFEEENTIRQGKNKEVYLLDEAFLSAMERGLPACCGVSVGFDRALMLRHKAHALQDVLPFTWAENAKI
jgi:lysyl-tRNA synthetase class 2